jgi:hypothetical protein
MPEEQLSGIKLQPRDFALLRGLFESRLMTLAHITHLYFAGQKETAKKRVQKLKASGVIRERPRRVSDPSILHLTWKGYLSLRDTGYVDDDSRLTPKQFSRRMRVSTLTLSHEIAIGDVQCACTLAMRVLTDFQLLEFNVWPRRFAFTVDREFGRICVQPDGYLRILENGAERQSELHFFLEVDRGTETIERLADKCVNYRQYQRSGRYAEFCGHSRDNANARSFQVLVICKSEQRRDNLAERLLQLQPPFSTMVLITTLSEYDRDSLGKIWMTPSAFRRRVAIRPLHDSAKLDRDLGRDEGLHRFSFTMTNLFGIK